MVAAFWFGVRQGGRTLWSALCEGRIIRGCVLVVSPTFHFTSVVVVCVSDSVLIAQCKVVPTILLAKSGSAKATLGTGLHTTYHTVDSRQENSVGRSSSGDHFIFSLFLTVVGVLGPKNSPRWLSKPWSVKVSHFG